MYFLGIKPSIRLINHIIVVHRTWTILVINYVKGDKDIKNLSNRNYDSQEKGYWSPVHEFESGNQRELIAD